MYGPQRRISVPLSALEHVAYCPRQAALIHVDGYFDASTDTVRGDLAHAAVDRAGPNQDRHGQRIWHSLPVWNDKLGLHGVCDTVEFTEGGPMPVEHKSGGYRPGGPADLQVAGQALCLREMFTAPVRIGVVLLAGAGNATRSGLTTPWSPESGSLMMPSAGSSRRAQFLSW